MAKGFKHGSSSSPLNFKVVAYPGKDALKAATPAENTIGIVTSNKITSWVFSSTAPATPVEGMVWIATGVTSSTSFNVLKKNELRVYPLFARQYTGGIWEEVTAFTYMNNAWSSWRMYLFEDGNEHKEITGGWTGGVNNGTLSVNNLEISRTVNKIDFTNYSTLYVELSENNCPGKAWQLISVTENSATTGDAAHETDYAARWIINPPDFQIVSGLKTIDVTNLTGSYYVKLSAYSTTMTATKIYIE